MGAVLRTEPGLVVVGMAGSGAELDPVLYRTRPDVVPIDYHLPGEDGLSICRRVKEAVPAPAGDPVLGVHLAVAGGAGAGGRRRRHPGQGGHRPEVCETVRLAARGRAAMWPVPPELREAAEQAVGDSDAPVLQMLLEEASPAEVMDRHNLDRAAYDACVDRMLARLRVPVRPAR